VTIKYTRMTTRSKARCDFSERKNRPGEIENDDKSDIPYRVRATITLLYKRPERDKPSRSTQRQWSFSLEGSNNGKHRTPRPILRCCKSETGDLEGLAPGADYSPARTSVQADLIRSGPSGLFRS